MTITSASVVNEALELIAAQTTIAALNDGSPAGNAAGILYAPVVDLLLRQLNPAFARRIAALAVATATPLIPWAYEYAYPADSLRLRQVRPGTAGNDPQPIRAQVAFDTVGGNPAKVILCNLASAYAAYTTSAAGVGQEGLWDNAFLEAAVRRLANPLAMALAGRPDFARELLAESLQIAQMAETIDEE